MCDKVDAFCEHISNSMLTTMVERPSALMRAKKLPDSVYIFHVEKLLKARQQSERAGSDYQGDRYQAHQWGKESTKHDRERGCLVSPVISELPLLRESDTQASHLRVHDMGVSQM